MNVFCLDRDPVTAARWLCDKHISKMIVESGQMLTYLFTVEQLATAPLTKKGKPWKQSARHRNHPCSIWVRESRANADWLCRHALAMEVERILRGFKPHHSVAFIRWCADRIASHPFGLGDLTEFAVAISDDKLCRQHSDFAAADVVGKYRLYYKYDKPFATWKRNRPDWM